MSLAAHSLLRLAQFPDTTCWSRPCIKTKMLTLSKATFWTPAQDLAHYTMYTIVPRPLSGRRRDQMCLTARGCYNLLSDSRRAEDCCAHTWSYCDRQMSSRRS